MHITSIAERGSSGEGFIIRLSEGSSFFVSTAFLFSHPYSEDQNISEDDHHLLQVEDERIRAVRKAGDLLARAEQSSGGLLVKLLQRGFSREAAQAAVDRVIELGLLDDERFARFWISNRLRQHPEGRSALYQGLLSRGVEGVCAGNVIQEVFGERELEEALFKAGDKLSRRYGDDNTKLKAALIRRGFTGRQVQYYLEKREE